MSYAGAGSARVIGKKGVKSMSDIPTIFLIDSDTAAWLVVHRIAKQMGVNAEHYLNAEDFLAAETRQKPGCIVAEFRLLGMNGIELQTALRTDCIAIPVVFVTAHAEIAFVVRAMQHGAVSVLEKPASEQELWDAIQQALARDQAVRRIDASHSAVRRRLSRLTPKEREVLELLVDGKTNKTIARRLGLSTRTVENRRHHIFKKTGTDSIAQLVRLILQAETEQDRE